MSPPPSSSKLEPSQKVSKLLLFSIFAVAARFDESSMPLPPPGEMWEAGLEYLNSARDILKTIFHRSKASTVQALLLLGHREYGMGSMEQAWGYIGMAIRMAVDLGFNRNCDQWKVNGKNIFSEEEAQTRRQIWWACCLGDRYSAVYMGRPLFIRDEDYDTPLPKIIPEEENELWMTLPGDPAPRDYTPIPCRIMTCFGALGGLSVVVGEIMNKIYPIVQTARISRRTLHNTLEAKLHQWYIGLPEELQYDPKSKRPLPPPHVLFLHVRYWGAVLLLHRAFIPNWAGPDAVLKARSGDADTLALKAFDLAQGAASTLSSILTSSRDRFTLKRCTPFATSYLLSAGIMHVLTLTLRPGNPAASLGLRQCLAALKELEIIWPSAARAWELLNGVELVMDNPKDSIQRTERHKRYADDAFGREKSSELLSEEAFGALENQRDSTSQNINTGVQDLSQRMMAQMLGLDIPGIQPSTSFLPGYEWWPVAQQPAPHNIHNMTAQTPYGSPPLPAEGSVYGGLGGIYGQPLHQDTFSGEYTSPLQQWNNGQEFEYRYPV